MKSNTIRDQDGARRPIAGNSPPCPFCESQFTKIKDKRMRDYDRDGDVYRRRECMECGGRFTTFEISKDVYEFVKQERSSRSRGKNLWTRIKSGLGIDRFENLAIIDPSKETLELWNDPIFVKGIEQGVLIGLQKTFEFRRGEVK